MNRNRLWRLLKILRLASAPEPLNAEDMAGSLGVSRRTFHRDREVLEDAGIPIMYDGEGYRLAGKIFLPAVHLQWDEGLALMITLRAAMDSGGTPFSDSLQDALEKIESGIPPGVKEEIASAGEEINIEQKPMVDMSQHNDTFRALWGACRDHELMQIGYWGRDDEAPSRREVEPLAIFHRWRAWYLVAHCRLRDELRTFRIDRITDLSFPGEYFVPPRDFDLEEYLARAWLVEGGEPVDVEIAFSGVAARLVRELSWHPTQTTRKSPDGRVIAHFRTGGLRELAEWVVGFGGEAEALAPAELREMVLGLGRAIVEVHADTRE